MEGQMMTEEECLAAIARLAVAERDGTAEKKHLAIGPFTCYLLISAIQLVMRHPNLGEGPTVGVLTQLRDQLITAFPEGGQVREILAMGMDPQYDQPVIDTTDAPTAVGCPQCDSHAWHLGDDQDLTCKRCGYSTTMEKLMASLGMAGGVIEMPLANIPVRVDSENVYFSCPACSGTDWRAGKDTYTCDSCRTIFARETILALIDRMITRAGSAHS
jgi:ssDNA-binding Zn-finger/Zn-ribbon topoisomerase 1